ncbi:MAG TPA: amino acid adenylation domain-containing protein [Thermoanaerobaculia bacterium]|nr:amino acid adenylation domain-containing protein [Thermoanaerobaculia bacterium]
MTTSEPRPADGRAAVAGFPLSPQQKRLWRLGPERSLLRCQCEARLRRDLDRAALRRALGRARARHGILRTTFQRRAGMRYPLQVIAAATAVTAEWAELDLARLADDAARRRAVEQVAAGIGRRPFDAALGPPLRVTLLTLAPADHVLVLSLPAICGDARTLLNLLHELARDLDGERGTPGTPEDAEEAAGTLPVQFVEFAQWQNSLPADPGAAAGYAVWQGAGGATPALPLPWERRPAAAGEVEADQVAAVAGVVDPAPAAALAALAARRGAPLPALLLACWQILLLRLSGEPEVVVAAVLDGRKFEELGPGLGPFASAVPIRGRRDPAAPFGEALRRTQESWATAGEWQEYYLLSPYAEPAAEGAAGAVGFEAETWPESIGALAVGGRHVCVEPFRLKLAWLLGGERLRFEIQYAGDAGGRLDAARLARSLLALLAGVAADPEATVGSLPLLAPAERHQLLREWNDTAAPAPALPTLDRLFAAQAERTPAAVAAACEQRTLSYAELDARANRLARRLRRLGLGPDRIVAICVMDPLAMMVGLLAILASGAAYLPLDPTHPRERLAFMLGQAGAAALVTEEALLTTLPAAALPSVCVDRDRAAIAAESACRLDSGATAANLAYVLYTSGSTGRPKGVMVTHRGLVNYLGWAVAAYQLARGTGAPVHSPIGFDLTITALFAPLLAGRTVQLLPLGPGVEALAAHLRTAAGCSLVKLTPAHLELLTAALPAATMAQCTRALVLGGEALSLQQLAPWRRQAPGTRLINEYGPTETVVGCCVHAVGAGAAAAGPVPIGRPIANTRLYVLDERLEPVPAGLPGELHVAGDGLARGYLGHPDATAERFLPDPFAGEPGARLYRTGDLVRAGTGDRGAAGAGALEYLGRADRQVKVRGYRVELGECETVLAGHPGIAACAVELREDVPGSPRLVAYLVPRDGSCPANGELLSWLRRELPEYMLPLAFVPLAALPLTANGKLDRAALPAPRAERARLAVHLALPETELERRISALWREVLHVERMGIHDNFFDLGGDSFLMFKVHRRLVEMAGREVPVTRMFQHTTIAALAAYLAAAEPAAPAAAAAQARADGRKAAHGVQRRRRAKGNAKGGNGVKGSGE